MSLKAKQTYLRGKSVFIVSLLVIGITILTVYLTGENYNRSLSSNLYLSLSIIGTILFLFMTYGLYRGIGLRDNYPKFRNFKKGDFATNIEFPNLPEAGSETGISGLIVSILLWIGMTILVFVLMILMEAIFWISIFLILVMLYWLFFRALKLVFSKSKETKGDIGKSISHAFMYTVLYLGWIFVIAYSTEALG